jgi:hypothetical protein
MGYLVGINFQGRGQLGKDRHIEGDSIKTAKK